MIQPVNALAPRVLSKGQFDDSKAPVGTTRRNLAIMNSLGISAVVGAVTTALSRSYTSTWQRAGAIGFGTGAAIMAFIMPHMLNKAGVKTIVNSSGDCFTKKNVLNEALETPKNIVYSKNLLKKAV